jgi:hypothetical protein
MVRIPHCLNNRLTDGGTQKNSYYGSTKELAKLSFVPIISFILLFTSHLRSRGSAIGKVNGYGLDVRRVGVRVPAGPIIFHFSVSFRPALEPTQPPVQWVQLTFSQGVKRPVPEAGHSRSTSAKVKKTWVYTSIPPQVFMALCLS